MVLWNDHPMSKKYFNGSMGTLVRFSDSGWPVVRIERTGEEVELRLERWERLDARGQTIAWKSQVPVKLAYGVTIHKSQGLTLDYAEVDCQGVFERGQTYVALSRVRRLDGLRLRNWSPAYVAANQDAIRFMDRMQLEPYEDR